MLRGRPLDARLHRCYPSPTHRRSPPIGAVTGACSPWAWSWSYVYSYNVRVVGLCVRYRVIMVSTIGIRRTAPWIKIPAFHDFSFGATGEVCNPIDTDVKRGQAECTAMTSRTTATTRTPSDPQRATFVTHPYYVLGAWSGWHDRRAAGSLSVGDASDEPDTGHGPYLTTS